MKAQTLHSATSPNLPAILDVEASGFGAASYPVEVGLVLSGGERYCSLIEPAAHWVHWDPAAAAMHGLSREQLFANGSSAAVVARELNEFAAGQTLYCDGWAVDYPWLRTLYQAAQMSMTFRVSAIEMLLTERDLAVWDAIKVSKGHELGERRHRASSDAWVIQETYRAVVAARTADA